MKLLCVDCTKFPPSFLVAEAMGQSIGTTRMLDWSEVPAYAKWVGVTGGRDLFDAFEVTLINDGMLWLWPVDAEGDALHDECKADRIEHHDFGSVIWWTPKVRCETCCGQGHFELDGHMPEDPEDWCMNCDGDGYVWGREFMTDMNGELLSEHACA